MPERWIVPQFHIDTNRINAKGRLPHMNQLEEWRQNGVILLEMSEIAAGEGKQGRNPDRSRKVMSHIYTMTMANTSEERREIDKIERILFPGGNLTRADRNDAEIVFNAKKYGATLITADGDILRCRDELAMLPVQIVTDAEAVELIRKKVRERDEVARLVATRTGQPLPNWVGKD